MSEDVPGPDKTVLENALRWFQSYFRERLVSPIESQFPNYPLTSEIRAVLDGTSATLTVVGAWSGSSIHAAEVVAKLSTANRERLPLFKQIMLLYRRERASHAERLTEKTFHLEMVSTLEREVKALDALAGEPTFQQIEPLRLPRLKDFLPVQHIEAATLNPVSIAQRQYDEKFHILQAPNLFLSDLAYFRAKCEQRDTLLAIAFMDIDDFKQFNSQHTETKVDRNLLPRFMQTIEAHMFHHGLAYRQGGDEYLILVPSMSNSLCLSFFDELRCKLAELKYAEIDKKTTVSIGVCFAEPDSPLTDRELLERANRAKKFAKEKGKNCIASYVGSRMLPEELRVLKPST
jgi:diguanylate cyclase (GGDEF)-like protein